LIDDSLLHSHYCLARALPQTASPDRYQENQVCHRQLKTGGLNQIAPTKDIVDRQSVAGQNNAAPKVGKPLPLSDTGRVALYIPDAQLSEIWAR
jgi:hypothetical protein